MKPGFAWHSYKKDATGWELDGLINNEVLLQSVNGVRPLNFRLNN